MISIIMPVYNAEKYLRETIQSILRQSYKDYELICVDDASCDSTTEILQQFQNQDKRIKIMYNKRHLGAAASRNRGITESLGNYITFLDGDDIFDEDMLRFAYNKLEETGADIVMYKYMHVPSQEIYEKKYVCHTRNFIKQFTQQPFSIGECDPITYMKWSSSPCDKCFKKSFITENDLRFQTLSSANDAYFVEMALLFAPKVIALNSEKVMVYARDHDNPTRISFDRDPMCVYYAMEKIGRALIDRKVFEPLSEHYYLRTFYNLRGALLKTKTDKNKKAFYDFLRDEGIDHLISLAPSWYGKMNLHIHTLFQNFKELEYDTHWYLYENLLAYYLRENSSIIENIFKKYRECKKILWGAGENGRVFLKYLNENGAEVSVVVDKSNEKQGKIIEGYNISKPLDVIEDNDVIFTTSYSVSRGVKEYLKDRKITVVDIGELLGKD